MQNHLSEFGFAALTVSIAINGYFLKGYAQSIKEILKMVHAILEWKSGLEVQQKILMDDYNARMRNARDISQGFRHNLEE
jgi:hypothetical protein